MEKFFKILSRLPALAAASLLGYLLHGFTSLPVTVSSLSPDAKRLVSLVERPSAIDRNFEIRLKDLTSKKIRTLFRSPDEGRPPGTERFVWSADGSHFLLLGRRFFTPNQSLVIDGEQAYLLMDITTEKIWCNAGQQKRYPSFGIEELRAKKWVGWTP